MDQIRIKDLEVYCNHGVFPEENVLGQRFVVDVILHTDTRAAGRTDDLSQSIDYGQTSHQIVKILQGHTYKLIEAVAENLARELLLTTAHLKAVDVEVKKPWAPVGLPLDTVSVKIHRAWHSAFIALGSNMGDKKQHLETAIEKLGAMEASSVVQVSSMIQTEPYGVLDQDVFLNGMAEIKTLLSPQELLEQLHKIEAEEGRVRVEHWGPRTLDLDIVFYDDAIIDTPELHVPHVDMQNRDFVLEPLCEIAPYKRHPVLNQTVQQMLAGLKEEK